METENRGYWAAAAALAAVLLVPILSVEIPPLLDYPNHLARLFVLAHGAADPFLSRVYTTHWAVIPDIAIDVIGPPLLMLFGLNTAGRILLALALLLPVAGTMAYSRAVFGRNSWWALGSGLVAYDMAFMLGFLNSQIAMALALFAAAAWIRGRDVRPAATIAVVSMAAVVIFFVHVIGVAFLGVLLCAHEIVMLARSRGRGFLRRIALAVLPFVLPLALYALSPLAAVDRPVLYTWRYWEVLWVFAPFLTHDLRTDLATAALVAAAVLALLLTRRARVAPQAAIAVLILAVCYPFTPDSIQGGGFINMRLPVLAGFLVFAGILPDRLPRTAARALFAAFAILLAVRMTMLTMTWQGQTRDIADLRAVIADVPPASRVLVVMLPEGENPAWRTNMPAHRRSSGDVDLFIHLPALLVSERGSMWPLLFSNASKQPLQVRPEWTASTRPEGMPPPYSWLSADAPPAALRDLAPYMDDWRSKFDFVLVLLSGGVPERIRPDILERITGNDFVALYRIKKNG